MMERIKALRLEKGWRQKDLAEQTGVSSVAISHYEVGDRQPDPEFICRLCDLFGVTADYLLGRSNNPVPSVSDEDAEVLRAYHALTPEIRKIVDQALEPYRKESKADQAS